MGFNIPALLGTLASAVILPPLAIFAPPLALAIGNPLQVGERTSQLWDRLTGKQAELPPANLEAEIESDEIQQEPAVDIEEQEPLPIEEETPAAKEINKIKHRRPSSSTRKPKVIKRKKSKATSKSNSTRHGRNLSGSSKRSRSSGGGSGSRSRRRTQPIF